MRRYSAVLLGYYGFGNLGDELLLRACINILQRCGIERGRIAVLSNNPEETAQKFNVHAVNRWSFNETVRIFRESERLILGGGGIFQDSTSVKSCIWYWGMMRLARFFGMKVYAIGQSVGPLRSGISEFFAGNALRNCEGVQVRDDNSLRLALCLGCKNAVRGYDLVLTLKPENGHVLSGSAAETGKYMLVNLRPCPELEHYREILRGHVDGETVGAAMSADDEEAMKGLGLREVVRVKTFGEAQELWRGAECAVGMRLHFGVLSRIFGTPTALMPYDVKVKEFALQSGVPCVGGEWAEPVKPKGIPDEVFEVEGFVRGMFSRQ